MPYSLNKIANIKRSQVNIATFYRNSNCQTNFTNKNPSFLRLQQCFVSQEHISTYSPTINYFLSDVFWRYSEVEHVTVTSKENSILRCDKMFSHTFSHLIVDCCCMCIRLGKKSILRDRERERESVCVVRERDRGL